MSAYPRIPLGEICAINPRIRKSDIPEEDMLVSFVPMAAVDGQFGMITAHEDRRLVDVSKGFTAFEDGDVLFAKITPCMENGKAALARHLTNGVGRGSTEFYVLRPGDKVLGEYVYHFVRQPRFREKAKRHFTGTAGQQRVPRSFMENVPVPLPALDEQRRIVGILNRAARIEHLHAQGARYLRNFTSAIFIKMFGDPVENPMGWRVRSLSELMGEFRYGTSKKCSDTASGDAIPILRIPNVVNHSISWDDLKFTSLGESDLERLYLKTGDILFVRTNGNPDYIGRCAVFDGNRRAAYASYLIRARLNPDEAVNPHYISSSLALPEIRQIMLKLACTTAGNYNISIKNLGSIRIPIPTQKLQQKFLAILTKARKVVSMTEAASRASSTSSASLIARLLEGGV